MDTLPTLPPAEDEATQQQHYSNTLDPPFLVPDAENDNGRPYSEHYERIDFMTNGDLAWLNEGYDADNNNTIHEPNEQQKQQRSVRRGLDLGLTGSDFNATLTGNTKTGTAAATASRFARRLRPIVSRALLDLEQPAQETNHSGTQRHNTSNKEEEKEIVQDVSDAAPESEQRLLSRSAENTLWGRSHDRIAALQETLRGTQSRHPLFLLTHTSHVTDDGNIERGTSAAHSSSSSSSESSKQKVQLSPSGILLEAGLDSVTQRTQRALARLYATKDAQGALPAFGPRKAQENHLRATLAFLTQQQQELADRDNEDNITHSDNSMGLVGNTDEAQAGVSSPPAQDKPHVATTQQQQQQQSLRFEPLTMSAIRRRFGPPAMLSARVTPSVVSVLSLCSRASSLLRDDVRHEDDEEDSSSNNKRYDALHKAGRMKAGAAGSPLYAQGQARQAMRRYVGYLHTPDSVLRELAQKAQQPTRTTNNNNNNSVSSRVQRPRIKLCATMPFLNETLRDTRVLHAAKQAIVLDKIGLHKSGRQVVQDAMQATQALLRNHQQRRSSQERLAHEVRQWCDRTVLVTTTIMNVPQDKYSAAAESSSTSHSGGVVVFEDDPNEGYERDMRRIALEEAEVRMRNLLQRRRRIETQAGQTLVTTKNHTMKANSVNSNAGVSNQIDLQDHRRLCARFTPWGTSTDAEEEDKDAQSTLHGSRTEANVTRYGEEGKWQSADMSPHTRPTKHITYNNNTTSNEEEDSKTPLLTSAEEGLLTLVMFAVSRAGTLLTQTRHYETRTSLVKQLQEAVQADKMAVARRGRPSFFTTTTTLSSPSSSHATQSAATTTAAPVPQESSNSDKNKEEERDMLGYVYLKGIGSNGHDLRCLRELDTLLLAQEHEAETTTTGVPQVVPVMLYCNTNVSASNIANSRTSPCPSSPSVVTPSHRRNYSSQATPCKDIVFPVDALELLYALPAVTVQALLEQTTRTATTVTSQGGGLSAGFQLSLSRSVQQLWRRVLRQYLQTPHHHRSHPSHDSSSNGVESTVSNTTKDELRVVGFRVDVAAAIATSRWRARTLKRIADALHTRLQATMAAAAAAMGSRMSLMHSSPSTPTPTQTEQQELPTYQKDTTRDTTRHEHHPSMMGLLSYGMEHRPTPSISSSSPCAHKGSVTGQRSSNHGSEACEEDAQAMVVGPQMINDIPFAPPTRACYPLDMRNLYVRATLAAEECDGTLRTRLTRLVQRYRDLCATTINITTDTTSGSSEAGVSLATNLQRWAAMQQLYDLEANYAQTLSTFYEHECTVHEFNAHVGHYNAFQIREGRIWGPLYRSSLCISYLLCKYLSLHGLEQLPEDYVALLHPVALFLGCSGGHREIRVKLPERMVDILERAKRVRLHLESMPWKAQEERQLAEAVKVVGQCGQPARIVTCLATEEDVLFVPLTVVAGPQHDFTELPHLA